MKKRSVVLLSVILIIAILAAGSFAYYSDQEKVAGNGFAAGKLDLQLGSTQMPFNVVDVVPGQSGKSKVVITNDEGSIPGMLNVSLANIVQLENEIIEPEQGLNGEYTPNLGELGIFLNFIAFVDVNQNGSFDSGDIQLSYNSQVLPYSQINYFAGWKLWPGQSAGPWNNVMEMASGQSVDIVIMWEFPPESQDANYSQNISQTDSLGFDVVFDLVQSH